MEAEAASLASFAGDVRLTKGAFFGGLRTGTAAVAELDYITIEGVV